MPDTCATEGLRPFFQAFEAAAAAVDVDALARLYAPAILVAGPGGSQVVKSADLLLAIPKRRQMFEAAGWRGTTLAGLREERLDDRYTLARTEWRFQFAARDGASSELTLPATYIVDRSDGEPRIVVYVMHHDIARVLKERGLLA
jgi:ketosteroid isomerase-like protein